jgi:hypothetical protein
MTEYEIHTTANYMTDGGTEEGHYFVCYRWANSIAEAEEMLLGELKRLGYYYNIEMDTIEV